MAVVEATYKVVGMTCQSCAESIQTLLQHIPGVERAEVHFAAQEVIVKHETEKAPFEKLKAALLPAGYELLPDAQAQQMARQRYLRTLSKHIVLAGTSAAVGMSMHFLPTQISKAGGWIYYFLAITLILHIGGKYFLRPAWQQLRIRQLTMDTLVSLGLLGSAVLGGIELYRGEWGHATTAGAEILFFVLIGKYLEEKARHRAQSILDSFSTLAVPTARRLSERGTEVVPTQTLAIGDVVEVRENEVLPVDGVIVAGATTVSESLLTGESMPLEKSVGSRVWAGTHNLSGKVLVKVDVPVQETFLAQLVLRVQKAQSSRAQLQRLADQISAVFIPIVIGLAIGTLILHFWRGEGGLHPWERMLSVLVISCPCALGLATPIAVQMAIGSAAGSQMLLREVSQLEALSQATIWAFDKTGTLTHGRARVKSATWYAPEDAPYVLAAARRSLHPLSQALASYLSTAYSETAPEPHVTELPGKGIIALFPEKKVYLGSPSWIAEKHANLPPTGSTAVVAATQERLIGLFTFEDEVRSGLRPFLESLKKMGKKRVMLTGDASEAAEFVAEKLGIDEVHKGFSPFDKARWIEESQSKGEKIVFVGDGINDALALQTAYVGIAVHRSAGPAAQSAGIALLRDTELALPALYNLSIRLRNIIIQNLIWAFSYNLVALPAAMGLIPGLTLSPGISALLMSLSSLMVVLNSLRLKV
ncbi:MAG: cation-translocating P-type ATPase [Bacteroidia bacterium]|nr:cation-translocating P-type ATPase [Bacteroidia bacterium]